MNRDTVGVLGDTAYVTVLALLYRHAVLGRHMLPDDRAIGGAREFKGGLAMGHLHSKVLIFFLEFRRFSESAGAPVPEKGTLIWLQRITTLNSKHEHSNRQPSMYHHVIRHAGRRRL
jgi:hypothetical protein